MTAPASEVGRVRRPVKELFERVVTLVLLVPGVPVMAACALAIKAEGLLDPAARGPVFFKETRMSRGRRFELLKFRTLNRAAIKSLGPGPTHIKALEGGEHLTRVGRVLHQWYLDELPQLLNIVRGDMHLIGTRPWPLDIYEAELARGVTRKRDMPAGLIGPVQSQKGAVDAGDADVDEEYWEAYKTWPTWRLLRLDLSIIAKSIRVMLEHKGL